MADSRTNTQFRIRSKTDGKRHPIGGEEADPIEILGHPVRIFTDHSDRVVAVLFVNAHRKQGGNTV